MPGTTEVRMGIPDHATMVRNILDVNSRATMEQVKAGCYWYGNAGRIIRTLAEATETDVYRFAHALAALSPRNPWRWNVQDAYAFAAAAKAGGPVPTATTFKHNRRMAWEALTNPGAPWRGSALKVRAFVAACLGDFNSVVVDVWAYRVATGESPRSISKRDYRAISEAYIEAANTIGISPSSMQAVTWIVAQSEGLATRRVSRDMFKAGTDPIVINTMQNED